MIETTCLCGAVHVAVAARPEFINECNCALCRKSGARWAYLDPAEVTVSGATSRFLRTDKPDPGAELHFCPTCGTTTHFVLSESAVARFGNTMMGVNLRLAPDAALAGIELRFPDGAAWDGEGAFGHVRDAILIGVG